MLLRFLNTKAKAFTVFLFSIISIGTFIASLLIAMSICQKWYGLIIGVLLMLLAIPFHAFAKKRPTYYLISILLNSVGNGFSVSAYYSENNVSVGLHELIISAIPAAVILLLICLLLQIFPKTKRVTLTIAAIINMVLIIISVVFWIADGTICYSFGFFCLIIALFYICVFGITINHSERSVLRDISFGSFGYFIAIAIIVTLILSEGEFLEALDVGSDSNGKKKAKSD